METPLKQRPGTLRHLVTPGVFALLLFSLAPYAPVSTLLTDLPSHFVLQYFIGSFIAAGVALAFRCPRHLLAVTAVCAVLNAAQLWPLLPHGGVASAGPSLKILQVNTLFLNEGPAALQRVIEAESPDIIVGAEVNSPFAYMFRGLKGYTVSAIYPADETPRGLVLLSKNGTPTVQRIFLDDKRIPALEWALDFGGRRWRFLSIHPFTPIYNIAERDAEFEAIAKNYAHDTSDILVILGDFNATIYCPALKKLTASLALRNAREGQGALGTFPANFGLPFLRIPIDNLLYRGDVAVTDYRLGPDIGSDHLPSLITLSLSKAAP